MSSRPPNLDIKCVTWSESKIPLAYIRRRVFIDEQKVPEDEEWESLDEHSDTYHFIVEYNQQPIGCCRLLPTGQIGRMAILKDHRGKGFGKQLLNAVLQQLQIENFTQKQTLTPFLHAQVHAIPFYEALGFTPSSDDLFMEAGIEHKVMTLKWGNALNETLYGDKVLRLENFSSFNQHINQILGGAKRTATLYTTQLYPNLWATPTIVSAFSNLARRSQHSKIRILVLDPTTLYRGNHPLLLLSQRLSSRSEIKVANKDNDRTVHAFIIVDDRKLVYFNNEEELAGFANYCAPAECRALNEKFNTLWNYSSHTDTNLSQLLI